MAQLTDDCFAFSGPLLPIARHGAADRRARDAGRRNRDGAACAPRAAACWPRDVIAPLDLPPFDNSAVDGYAVRHARSRRRGRDAARDRRPGDRRQRGAQPLGAGEATRIFTGAPMPAGADTVFMQEDVQAEGGTVIVPAGLKRGANRRLAGEDVRKGAIVLPAGRRLAAQDVALAAAVGLTQRSTCAGACASRCSRPATRSSSPARRGRAAALYDANRYLLRRHARSARRRGHRPRHPRGRSGSAGEGDRAPRRASTTWC